MKDIIENKTTSQLIESISQLLVAARQKIVAQVNDTLVQTYFQIDRMIVEDEQNHNDRAEYGKQTIKKLSRALTERFGKGFSRVSLQNMRLLFLKYEKSQSLIDKLTWTHYCELLSISDDSKRSFYEKECINAHWSVRELKRQINSSLFECLLLSKGNANKEQVLALALKGNEIAKPEDIIRDPYVFEFLGIAENKPLFESDLEKALVRQIEKFLLELGRGFMFVGTQQRITLGNHHYYVDMVFYNKILKAYVLIELKTSKLMPEAVGQLNMYLNYYGNSSASQWLHHAPLASSSTISYFHVLPLPPMQRKPPPFSQHPSATSSMLQSARSLLAILPLPLTWKRLATPKKRQSRYSARSRTSAISATPSCAVPATLST